MIFKGTRILVSDALELTEAGYSAQSIARQYRRIIKPEAVEEALALTNQGLIREVVTRIRTREPA